MEQYAPLHHHLLERYQEWKRNKYPSLQNLYTDLELHGQNPDFMVIACCDSRLPVSEIFGEKAGEIFVHRNIANLVPVYSKQDMQHSCTSSTIEFAVKTLKIKHILVIGHSGCGGVAHYDSLCQKNHVVANPNKDFISNWVEILSPAYAKVQHIANHAERLEALEKQAILVSLENLLSFPYVKESVENGTLSISGLWYKLSKGQLYYYKTSSKQFEVV